MTASIISNVPGNARIITARYGGKCAGCNQPYEANDQILHVPGRAWHVKCPEQQSLDIPDLTPHKQEGPVIHDGMYTIVFPGTEQRCTLRFQTMPQDHPRFANRTIVSFLSGPDNEKDYTGFAFFTGGKLQVWQRYRENEALPVIAARILEDPAGATEAYALASKRCAACNRLLTVPASLHRGLGPICARRRAGEQVEGED